MRLAVLVVVLATALPAAAARRLLYVTFSGGFVHSTVAFSQPIVVDIGRRTGAFDTVVTSDTSQINADNLTNFDAVFFYTSGEMPLSPAQKQALLDFVRGGKGVGAVHSATDTNYTWPEWGEMIGGYFDGHPWTQTVRIAVEDPPHPAVAHLAPSFTVMDEIYQFRSFSRDRVRVLMTLDASSVSLAAEGINRTDNDFALAWVRQFGSGRVFYSALGHFEAIWSDPRFQQHLLEGIRWIMGDVPGSAQPRSRPGSAPPRISAGGAVNGASFAAAPGNSAAPGAILSIFGTNLAAETRLAASLPLPTSLGGAAATISGRPAPLFFAAPDQLNIQVPYDITPGTPISVTVTTALGSSPAESAPSAAAAPGIFTLDSSGRGVAAALHPDGRVINTQQPARRGQTVQLFLTGLGATTPAVPAGAAAPASPPARTNATAAVTIGGRAAEVPFSGLAPGFAGLNQINFVVPAATPAGDAIELRVGDSNRVTIAVAP